MTAGEVPLPGLRGDRPVGFLAALGTLRVLVQEAGHADTRLRWDLAGGARTPVLCTDLPDLPDLPAVAAALAAIIGSVDDRGVLPGMPPDWPPPRAGSGGGDLALAWPPTLPPASSSGVQWWPACLVDHRRGQQVLRSPYVARRGQQTLRTFFGAPLARLRSGEVDLAASLAVGRRLPGYTGELLDAGALAEGSGADPGQVWLATMALPLLGPVSVGPGFDGGVRATAPGWAWRPGAVAHMVWPLWTPPLDVHAAQVLLGHPGWQPGAGLVRTGGGDVWDPAGTWDVRVAPQVRGWLVDPGLAAALGVAVVCTAVREHVAGSSYDRPLCAAGPVPVGEDR